MRILHTIEVNSHTVTLRILALFCSTLIACSGCGIVQVVFKESANGTEDDAVEIPPIDTLNSDFLARDDAGEILDQMPSLESRAFHSFDANLLRLGSLGTALTDRHKASLTGQFALQRFYENLNEPAASIHEAWADRIVEAMRSGRDGSFSSPYRTLTKGDALTFVKRTGDEPIGAIWEQSENYSMLARILVKTQGNRNVSVYFELISYDALTRLFNEPDKVKPIDILKRLITEHDDDAAKIAYGRTLMSFAVLASDRNRQRAQGVSFLRSALNNSNILSSYYYAEALVSQAQASRSENMRSRYFNSAREHFRTAIAAGFDNAMVGLGRLYLSGVFGNGENQQGLDLLEQARSLGNHDASFILATFYRMGVIVEEDEAKSQQLFVEALTNGNERQRKVVIEHLSRNTNDSPFTQELYEKVFDMAQQKDAVAMTILARIHALGLYETQNLRKAKSWYRRAVRVNRVDPETVNEVAWVLATSKIHELREPRYAVRIMKNMMSQDETARSNAPYIDTWAAAYAANGNFKKAVELQREAIESAKKDTADARLLQILEDHLILFERERALDEEVP